MASVFDLMCAHYGLDRGLGGACADFRDLVPYGRLAGADHRCCGGEAVEVARGFAANAEKTNGRSMVIIGAGVNHWYQQDMTYRSVINFLMMCGTIGVSGGGWSHYVGQEALRPLCGWTMLTFALDWVRRRADGRDLVLLRPSDQWRYETLGVDELSPRSPIPPPIAAP